MEFVVVTFPTARSVFVDDQLAGHTNKMIRIQAGTHTFDLGDPPGYGPPLLTIPVIGTSFETPMVLSFTPVVALAAAGADVSTISTAFSLRKRPTKKGARQQGVTKPAAAKKSASASNKGSTIATRVFDARPDRLDFRDLVYRSPLRSLPVHFPSNDQLAALLPGYFRAGLILDQGDDGACTGFGLACVVNHMLWLRHIESGSRKKFVSVSPRMLYELAKRYDEWPGDNYEGSSCRGALKGWHKHGVCSEPLWPYAFNAAGNAVFAPPKDGWEADSLSRTLGVYYRVTRESIVDLQSAIVNIGAVYVSARVHSGWDTLTHTHAVAAPRKHADVPDIPAPKKPGQLSGHCFAFVGYDEHGFIVQNSWGDSWGAGGFGRMSYTDWVAHGTDAWACALGVPAVPSEAKTEAVRWHQPGGRSLSRLEGGGKAARNSADDPWPVDHEFLHREYEPLKTVDAYQCTVVSGNDGDVMVRDMTMGEDDAAVQYVKDIVVNRPLRWFATQKGKKVKIAIYAHGGLNDEDGSIARIRMMAPYFCENGIYPIFLTWRTGPFETIQSMLEDWQQRIPGFGEERATGMLDWLEDQKDRALETIARPLGRGIWSEMRENASRSMRRGHGVDLLVKNLSALGTVLKAQDRSLDVHLIGHSAGSILLGHCLESMMDPNAPVQSYRVASCSLYAAACSVLFANQHFGMAADRGLLPFERLWLYCLNDENEKRDALPTPSKRIYGKSLLYLVSRSLDDTRKEPLLGMERAHLPKYVNDTDQWAAERLIEVKRWQQRWQASPGNADRLRIVTEQFVRNTRIGGQIQATHGSFDNNIRVLTETIERIRGSRLVSEMEWLDY